MKLRDRLLSRGRMKPIDGLLRRVGLMRTSQLAYDRLDVEWHAHEPTHIDMRFKSGLRVVGYVDSFYPNPNPLYATFQAPP